MILNPSDFDFLLSKGDPSNRHQPRDSILERFDPLSSRKSIAPPKKIVAIEESHSFSESSFDVPHEAQSSDSNIAECLVKLDSSNKSDTELHSESSSVSESYVTASLGDPKPKAVRGPNDFSQVKPNKPINSIFDCRVMTK